MKQNDYLLLWGRTDDGRWTFIDGNILRIFSTMPDADFLGAVARGLDVREGDIFLVHWHGWWRPRMTVYSVHRPTSIYERYTRNEEI